MNEILDRVGLGWRPQLAAGILSNLDRIDLVEVIADDLFDAARKVRRSLRTLAAQVPLTLHGVSLGLASAEPADRRRLDRMARLCDEVRPLYWSEHLAFVRGGGVEIGHLAAPPRTEATVEGALKNIRRASAVVGTSPLLENVATLIDPPGSVMSEADWVSEILLGSGGPLLLDLHNLYANAVNFGFDAVEFIARLPPRSVCAVHLAGGRWVSARGTRRLLDDHLHEVPCPVYDLLAEVGARVPHALTVVLERDGDFPPVEFLLNELDRAREALRRGRARLAARGREKEAA